MAGPRADAPAATSAAAAAPTPVVGPAATSGTATVAQATTSPSSFGEPTGAAGAVGSTVLALLLVVSVILALAWLAKRMPGIGSGGGNPSLKIIGSLALGPRERVVVVAVGDTQLLLSTGPHGTRALHTLEQPLPAATTPPSPFAQVLAQQFGRKKA